MAYQLAENGSLAIPKGDRPACDHGVTVKKDQANQGVAHSKMYEG